MKSKTADANTALMMAACVQNASQTGNRKILAVESMVKPDLPYGGAVIRVTRCGFCGSDLEKLIHHRAAPGQVLGHEVVGVVQEIHPDAPKAFAVGDRVAAAHHVPCGQCRYCLNQSESMCRQFKQSNITPGGFAEYTALSRDHLLKTVFKIPDTVSDAEASCIEPLACVLRAIQRGGNVIDGTVAVIGLGFIGLLAGQIYRSQGSRVIGLDILNDRLQFARDHRMVEAAFHAQNDWDVLVSTGDTSTEVDIVFLTVVTPETVRQAYTLVRDGGTIILFAAPANPAVTLDPVAHYYREINLIFSYSPSLAALQNSSRLIFTRQIRVAPLITHEFPLADIEKAVDSYRAGEAIKALIRFDNFDNTLTKEAS